MPPSLLRSLFSRRRGTPPTAEPTAPDPAIELDDAVTDPTEGEDLIDLACRAPFTSLHVDQFGDVRPCCQSTRILGSISDQTLTQVWQGDSLAELRDAVAQGDLSLGCQHCEWSGRQGREATYAVRFDRDRIPDPTAGPTRLELAPSNSCNLQCTMCNGDWSSSIRLHREGRPALPRRFGEAQLAEVEALAEGLDEIQLFGGEPLLMPEALRLLEIAAATDTRCTITTNGSILTPRVEALIDRPGVDIVVSVDGTSPDVYESIRCGASWSTLQDHLDQFQAIAARHGNRVDIAHCLMTTNWHEFADHLTWAARRGLEVYVNDVLSPIEASLHHLTPPELATLISTLEARQPDIDQLGAPWSDTWTKALTGLHQTLADAAGGGRHPHVGQVVASPSSDAPPTEARLPGIAVGPLFERLLERRGHTEARVQLGLDAQLRVTSTTSSGDLDQFSLVGLQELVGRSSSTVQTLLTGERRAETRSVLRWEPDEACEERRYGTDDHAVVERRTIATEPGHLELRFDYSTPATRQDERAAIESIAAHGTVIELVLDAAGHLRSVSPLDAAQRLGVRTEPGWSFRSPGDAFEGARAEPPPEAHTAYLGPWLTAMSLVWPDGHTLVALAHSSDEGTEVLLVEPISPDERADRP